MLLKDQLSLIQVFRLTWKVDLMILLCCTVAYLVDTYWLKSHVSIPVSISTVLGTAIAFFIGFNNNQAYGRWWEARKIWGALVNDSRSWARALLNYCSADPNGEAIHIARRMIYRHLAFLYALKAALRKAPDEYYTGYLADREIALVKAHSNIPNAILDQQAEDIQWLSREGVIDGFRFRELNGLLTRHCDNMGKSERIRNTVFPPSYLFFTRVFIWFYVILNTLMMSESVGMWSVLFGWAFGFVFHVTHQNGMSIMNPFEATVMAIPLDSISRTIEINLLQMLGHETVPSPVEPIDGQYLL
ncbi:bestrophin family protein [Chitinophaga japonensis]|uniref:Putative membrane protein n=1 Tax=Chitinophaga japonensis TaxID=104662 RepID=A0A562TE53_CHIJA|nr:bestrophin family ion channel [Chitinophaga japonensis]TWI91260.1 putative membrane protein [Chitinophaga japonensis]